MTQLTFDASKRAIMVAPEDNAILCAVAKIAVAHGHLEYILKMTIRSLAQMSIHEVLDATEYVSARELREIIKRLFKKKTKDDQLRLKLSALLTEAGRLTEKRNGLIHRPWAQDVEGDLIIKGDDHHWEPLPPANELEELATSIYDLIRRINHERMSGFIYDVMNPPPEPLPKED